MFFTTKFKVCGVQISIGITWPIAMVGKKSTMGFKNSLLFYSILLHHPNNCFENISVFLLAPHQHNSQKKKNLAKYWRGGICPSIPHPFSPFVHTKFYLCENPEPCLTCDLSNAITWIFLKCLQR